jgi:hypothetical protein
VSGEQALEIARRDAEKAYRDLSGLRPVVTRTAEGWRVDFELSAPDMNGGGPHYLIDDQTGAILQKRYEQ